MPAINAAVQALNDDPTSGFTTPSGRGHHKSHKCRTLTVHGVPVTAGGPTPSPEILRSMLPPTNGVADAVYERMRLLEQEARESRSTLTQQATTMDSLVRQTAAMDADRDATADYEINAGAGSRFEIFFGESPAVQGGTSCNQSKPPRSLSRRRLA